MHRCLAFEETPRGFILASPHLRQSFEDRPFSAALGRVLAAGRHTAVDAAGMLATQEGVSPETAARAFDDLFRQTAIEFGDDCLA